MISRWIAVALLLCASALATPASALLSRTFGGSPAPVGPASTPLCSVAGATCAYAYSTERQMVANPVASFTGTISGTTLTFPSNTGNVSTNQFVAGAGITPQTFWIVSGSGLSWTLNASPGSIGPEAMTTTPVALVVQRSVDSTNQAVGFTATGVVNTATVDTFCNASVGGTISRNCFVQGWPDQTGNNCLMYNATQSAMPNYMVSSAHSGLPQMQKAFQGSTSNLNFLLDNNGGSTSTLTNPCTTLTGGAQALFTSANDAYASNIGGQMGLQENIPGVVTGTMFSSFVAIPGLAFGGCPHQSGNFCGGLDTEGEGPQEGFTNAGISDVIQVSTTAGGTGPSNLYAQQPPAAEGQLGVSNQTIAHALATQNRMSWGTTGDHTSNGPSIMRSAAFFAQDFGNASTVAANLIANDDTFIKTLSTGYQGPGDLFVETSVSPGVSTGHVDQMQWLSQCASMRKCYAGYEGPALNVCKGSGACEDIGWVAGVVDVTTMSAYCGPVSGLNNCAAQVWYNEALNQNSLLNTVSTALDFTAVSSTHRPAVLFSGCSTTTITVCIQTTTTNYFTTSGIGISSGGYTMSAVAMRTSGAGLSSIYSSSTGTGPTTFLGFAASANTCQGTANNGGSNSVTLPCNDNVIHSITYDVSNAPSANLYVDGTAGTATVAAIQYSSVGLGVGATGAGADTCTCQLSEVLVYADTHAATFPTGIGSGGVATLRANQRAAFGF